MTVTAKVEWSAFLSANTAQAGNPVSIETSLRHMKVDGTFTHDKSMHLKYNFLILAPKSTLISSKKFTHLKGVLLGSTKQAGMGMRASKL